MVAGFNSLVRPPERTRKIRELAWTGVWKNKWTPPLASGSQNIAPCLS
jgi:hypothetical protein